MKLLKLTYIHIMMAKTMKWKQVRHRLQTAWCLRCKGKTLCDVRGYQLPSLTELRRMAKFGRLNADLLHDIANPLTAAILSLDSPNRNCKVANLQARANLRLMEEYLASARDQLQSPKVPVSFDIRSKITEVIEMLRPRLLQTKVQINYAQDNEYRLSCNPVRFIQAIGNLLSNSIEAYFNEATGDQNQKIDIKVWSNGKCIFISVRDFGCGIAEHQMDEIFQLSFTTKTANGRNLGFGLHIVKQFIESDCRGRITVSSTGKDGTVFILKLKAAP